MQYEVTIQETVTQVWVVEAEDGEAAKEFYDTGSLVFEKQNSFEIHDVEERDSDD